MTDSLGSNDAELLTAGNLPAYFHDALSEAADRRALDATDATKWYLANLLTRFARSDRFFDWSAETGRDLRPLALLYGDAVHAPSERERRLSFQRLGDVALFVAGLFEGVLARRAVKRDYFVTMGGGAYAYLASHPAPDADEQVFQELSDRFVIFVDVLSLVGMRGRQFDHGEILRLYKLWRETGSRHAERQLQALGVSLEGAGRAH